MKRIIAPLALLLASCALNLQPPQVTMPEEYTYTDSQPRNKELQSRWWAIFDDALLDSLQERALCHNRNLQIAASRIVEAHYTISTARAALLPSLRMSVQAEASRTPPSSPVGEVTIAPDIEWSVALFGALRHTTKQAQAQYLATEWNYRALTLTLTHQVATSYFTLRAAHHSLAIARQSHKLRMESAALIDSLARYGFSSGLDQEQAHSLVDVSASDIEQYRRALNQAQLSLALLIGSTPEYCILPTSLPHTTLPVDIPAGIPSQLLTHRPDLMQSQYELQAAAANVGIARSERFPSVALTTSGGVADGNARELFQQGGWAWSATAGFAQPLFSFGRLRRNEQIARQQYRQAALNYEQAALEALEDVESALTAVATLREEVLQWQNYVERNARIAQLQEALYRAGQSNYLDVISTQQTWYSSQLQQVQIIEQQYQALADLVLALGDGWQE